MRIKKFVLLLLVISFSINSAACKGRNITDNVYLPNDDLQENKTTDDLNLLSDDVKESSMRDDLSIISDEFNDANTLSNWKQLDEVEGYPNRIDKIDINQTSPNHLYLVPSSSAWWKGYHGVFLFKEVEGNFIITTRVRVTGKESNIPINPWTLAGVMARVSLDEISNKTSNPENWVYLMAGSGPNEGLVTDFKSTTNSKNEWNTREISDDWIELRLVRIGDMYLGLFRQAKKDWEIQGKWIRQDMPSKLQVGINATSDWEISKKYSAEEYNGKVIESNYSDLVAKYDYVYFNRPILSSDLEQKLKSSKFEEITDEELLELFSFD